MVPSRVGLFPVVDINKDGKADAVLLQTHDIMMRSRDSRGRKVTICEQSTEVRPVLATEAAGIYIPFSAQDMCKNEEDMARIKAKTYKNEGIFWRYTSANIPFATAVGGAQFYVGQSVTWVGQKKPQTIEAFRVGLNVKYRDEVAQHTLGSVEAMFSGCRAVALNQLVQVKE